MDTGKPGWAIIAPAKQKWLARRSDALMNEGKEDLDHELRTWKVVRCQREHAALLEYEPGTEGLDVEVALALSNDVKGRVYLLNLHPSTRAVTVFEDGEAVEELEESPESVAERFGCQLSSSAGAATVFPEPRAVSIAKGIAPAEAARALGVPLTPSHPIQFKSTSFGTLVTSDIDAGGFALDLSRAFPDRAAYAILTGPESGAFEVLMYRGGQRVGAFRIPPDDEPDPNFPVLGDIEGERTPDRILAILGVPAADMDRSS